MLLEHLFVTQMWEKDGTHRLQLSCHSLQVHWGPDYYYTWQLGSLCPTCLLPVHSFVSQLYQPAPTCGKPSLGSFCSLSIRDVGWVAPGQKACNCKMKNLNMVSLAPEAVDLLSKDQDPQPVSHPCLMSSNSSYAGESWAGESFT